MERDGWSGGGEEQTDLGRDIVSRQRGASDSFFQDDTIVYGCHGHVGCANIDDQGGGLASGKTERQR